jgi:P27 family predicted phage terminase small subunit
LSGPPPKQPDRRQRRNERTATERAGVGLVALPGGKVDPPPPPTGLLKATREDWSGFWESPLASLVVPADVPALRRLFALYDERLRAYQGYRRQRLAPGSMGQPTLNPLFGAMKGMDAEIRALEDRFGLSPIARLRLGVALGEAAKSLDELNRSLDADDDPDEPDADPRARLVEPAASPARRVVTADARPAGVPPHPPAAGPRRG